MDLLRELEALEAEAKALLEQVPKMARAMYPALVKHAGDHIQRIALLRKAAQNQQ